MIESEKEAHSLVKIALRFGGLRGDLASVGTEAGEERFRCGKVRRGCACKQDEDKDSGKVGRLHREADFTETGRRGASQGKTALAARLTARALSCEALTGRNGKVKCEQPFGS